MNKNWHIFFFFICLSYFIITFIAFINKETKFQILGLSILLLINPSINLYNSFKSTN